MSPKDKKYSSTVTIVVLLGGHAARMLPCLGDLYNDLVYTLVIDCAEELRRLGNATKAPNVHCFELGTNKSAQLLCENAPAELQKHLSVLGGMDASSGMGQSIAVAYYAGTLLEKSAEFRSFIRTSMVPQIRTDTGGAVQVIRVVFMGSLAGGTYSGAAEPIANALSKELLQLTSAIVMTPLLSTGGLTYEGLSKNAWMNSASSMMAQTRYVTDPARDPRDIRRLRLIEFGVLGQDEALRDAYLAQVEQAALSNFMMLDQQRRSPNDSLTGRFGNIQTWEAAFGTPLEVGEDIAAVAHEVYGDPLRDVLDRGTNITAVERIEVDHQRKQLNNEAVEEIVADAIDHPVQWALAKLMSPSYRHTVSLSARRSANELIDLSALEKEWAVSPASVAELDERLQLQRRLIELLGELSQEILERLEETEAALDIAATRVEKHHRRLKPAGVITHALAMLSSDNSKFSRLTDAALETRDLSDQLISLRSEQAAVEKALAFVNRSHDYLATKLREILQRLDEAGKPLANRPATVALIALDDRLTELLGIADEGETAFLDWLRRSVKHATVFGLAKVCGASAPEIEEIARQIVLDRAYATPAVPWGGRRRADRGHCVHVLPPLEADVAKLVTDAVRKLSNNTLIAVADKAPVVVNIVHLEMRLVRELDDVLTDPYKLGLKEAINSPCRLMNFPNDIDDLREFDIYDYLDPSSEETL